MEAGDRRTSVEVSVTRFPHAVLFSVLMAFSGGVSGAQPCPTGQQLDAKGICRVVPTCGPGQSLVLGKCLANCPDGKAPNSDGKCGKSCPAGQTFDPKGNCVVIPTCGPNQTLVLNKCFDNCPVGKKLGSDGKCL